MEGAEMKWLNGFPRDENCTDNMDSARLSGLLACLNHQQAPDLRSYLYSRWGIVRCPTPLNAEDWCQNPWNVTRDQLVPVIAGLVAQGHILDAQCLCKAIEARGWRAQNSEADKPGSIKPWYNGPDWFFGAEKEMCRNILRSGDNDSWLRAKILWDTKINPWHEPSQLICMMSLAGPEYIDGWKYLHPDWKRCVREYWLTGSRQDQEVNDFVIEALESGSWKKAA